MFFTPVALVSLPYSQPFKRAALGLFHGKTKRYGNNVPFSLHKTRRTWLPNSQNKSLYSEIMQGWITTRVTTRTLRTVDKMGGLDNYLLNTRTDLLGYEGMRLRVMLRERKTQLGAEAKALVDGPNAQTLLSRPQRSDLQPPL